MISAVPRRLANNKQWLRVADETWDEPLDPTFAGRVGGRWNLPGSFPVLYLNEDLDTARAQITKMLEGYPVRADDLDPPYVLVKVTLPSRQVVADAVTDVGLEALTLPSTYPLDTAGAPVPHRQCQAVGSAIKNEGLRGVDCRSAATPDGSGRELAWFPARRSSVPKPVGDPVPFATWWHADPGLLA